MENIYVIIGIVVAVVLIFLAIRLYLKKKKAPAMQPGESSGLDIDKLIGYLGGKENIQSVEGTLSKLNVVLKNTKAADIEALKAMGATGIVQNQNKLTVIFGKLSETIALEIQDRI